MKTRRRFVVTVIGCWLALCVTAVGQTEAQEADDLAKQVQNPLATLVTLPFQANYNTGVGEYDRTFFNLNVQPVIPYPGDKWNVIVRTIIPVNSVPQGQFESTFGLGDATMVIFFSPAKAGKLTWGIGPFIGLPSASNPEVLGSGKWGLGPEGVLFLQAGKWTMGGVAGNLWSIAGDPNRDDYSVFTAQYFINFNFGGGWALGTAPILSANWKAESGNQWTIPWGLQISKVTRFGNLREVSSVGQSLRRARPAARATQLYLDMYPALSAHGLTRGRRP